MLGRQQNVFVSVSNPVITGLDTAATKFHPTESMLYVVQGEIVACKQLLSSKDTHCSSTDVFDTDLSVVRTHSSPVTCIGIADSGWLLCSCSEEHIILSKLDGLLKTFSSATIGVDLGRILSCGMVVRGNKIITCLAKVNELVIIESTSRDSPLTEFGLLELTCIDISASLDRVNESFTWVNLVFFQDVLHVVGMSTGNSVSLKIWEVSSEDGFRLKDHRLACQSKAISGVDIRIGEGDPEEYTLVIVSPEGHCELFAVTVKGFCLLSRLKLEDFSLSSWEPLKNSEDANGNIQVEFRIFSAQFFYGDCDSGVEGVPENDNEESDIEVLNNSVTYFDKRQVQCPKIPIVVATSKGLWIVNLTSGEIEFCQPYHHFLPEAVSSVMVANAKLCTTRKSPIFTFAVQPICAKSVYTFQLQIQIGLDAENENFTICTTKPIEVKSVLRKKLSSPRPPKRPVPAGTLKRRPPTSGISHFRRSSSAGTSKLPPKSQSVKPSVSAGMVSPAAFRRMSLTTTAALASPATFRNRRMSTAPTAPSSRKPYANGSGTENDSPPVSARPVFMSPKKRYDGYSNLFEQQMKPDGLCLPTRLSSLSEMRMTFSVNGHEMAVGGDAAPLIIFKTYPQFQPMCLLKDPSRITSLQFSFNNKHHLLIGTNTGKTDIVNWKLEKEVLSLQVPNSKFKFKEHLHAQFFYLDKFILQPEDNEIVLYAFRIQEPNSVTLEAGRFQMSPKQIRALAAPNQFYSSTILWSGSNKCLAAFDLNAEKEIVSISNAHSKPISLIRINETPKGLGATFLCDLFLTATNSHYDPIKIWDLRIAKCVCRIGDLDVNKQRFVQNCRPALSPYGKYIASGFEENAISVYDIRKINAKVTTLCGMRSSVLDSCFDPNYSMIWSGCRDGKIWNFETS